MEGECALVGEEDCKKSGLCSEQGLCGVLGVKKNKECAALTDAMCRKSDACRVHGRCTAYSNECKPSNDEDCAKSLGCEENGACHFLETVRKGDSKYAPDPADDFPGPFSYLAHDVTIIYCGPKTDEDCRKSSECAEKGACSLDTGKAFALPHDVTRNTCQPKSDADCAESKVCKKYKMCCVSWSAENKCTLCKKHIGGLGH